MRVRVPAALDPAGPVAEEMERLWWVMLALSVAVFAVFLLLLALGSYRAPSPDEPDDRRQVRRWVVGGGVLMPLAVLVVVFGATLASMRATPAPEKAAASGALVVEVTGHQWWFEVHYPEEGVSTRNVLHLPVGRQVVLRVTSADVIHSFWVPELGGKVDMLPEDVNEMVVQADRAGTYRSRCSEFCGLHHATMRLRVVAEPPDRFADWLAGQR